MAKGIRALQRIQISQMPLGGTTDIATTYYLGMGVLDDIREVVFPNDDVGIVGGVSRSYTAKTGGEITLEGDLTFEQVPYILDSAIHTATPTTDSGSGYIYTYNLQWASTDPIESSDLSYLVVEGGDNQQAEIMRSAFCRELTISGAQGEPVQLSALFEGQGVATTTFTSGLTIPTIETMLVSKATLYIDPSSDTIGTTQKTTTLMNFELSLNPTGWKPVPVGDGNLYFSSVKYAPAPGDDMTLTVTFEHDGSATAEIANWRNEAERGLRLDITGTALTSSGTYSNKLMRFDLYGKWIDFEPLSEDAGNNQVTGTLRIGYSTAAAAKGSITVVNEVASLT